MKLVKVYCFGRRDTNPDEIMRRGYATLEFIQRDPSLFVIDDSVMEVEHTQITSDGRYLDSGPSR